MNKCRKFDMPRNVRSRFAKRRTEDATFSGVAGIRCVMSFQISVIFAVSI